MMKMLIDSRWVEASDGAWMEIRNPGTGAVIDKVPRATLQDAECAVAAAQGGKESMRKLTARARYEMLVRISEAIDARVPELGRLLAEENGKSIAQTRAEVGVTASIFRGFAEESKRIFGRVMPVDAVRGQERHFAVTIRQPLGVVAAIVPFNYPVELWGHKAAAALAAGNAVISKPPSACPLTLLKIAELMEQAGLPHSAHQILTGPGAMIGDFFARSPGIQLITVTGIPAVLVDRQWKGGYTSYVGPENFKIGQQNGQYIVDRLAGKGTLVVLKGGPADNSIGLNRTNGMLDIVKNVPGITVINAPDFGGWSKDGGLKQMENLLAANKKIDAVFCENDSMCLGAQRAISDAGRTTEMFLCGVDGQKEALVQIKNGSNYACTGLNNSDQIGRAGFNRVMAILAGATPPKDTYLPSPLITSDNVIKYYDPNSLF